VFLKRSVCSLMFLYHDAGLDGDVLRHWCISSFHVICLFVFLKRSVCSLMFLYHDAGLDGDVLRHWCISSFTPTRRQPVEDAMLCCDLLVLSIFLI
jgi:hypothetical protein